MDAILLTGEPAEGRSIERCIAALFAVALIVMGVLAKMSAQHVIASRGAGSKTQVEF